MTFPLIRPEDVPRMPTRQIQRLRARLDEECRDAAIRHDEILAARQRADLVRAVVEMAAERARRAEALALLGAEIAAAAMRNTRILGARRAAAVLAAGEPDEVTRVRRGELYALVDLDVRSACQSTRPVRRAS